jgi:hypothetical protein
MIFVVSPFPPDRCWDSRLALNKPTAAFNTVSIHCSLIVLALGSIDSVVK